MWFGAKSGHLRFFLVVAGAQGCSWDYSLLVGLAVVGVCLVSLVAVWKVRRRRSKAGERGAAGRGRGLLAACASRIFRRSGLASVGFTSATLKQL